ncbi:MAG: CoA transferase [Comamonadaceae bacterium]|nr:CoA transferase [Comamonadaceae bacterium]
MANKKYPLEGIVVLDLGQVYQGPYCGFLMAMAGARVIKIEPPHGDSVRTRTDAPGGNSLAFSMLNSNKEGMVLDLKTEAGRELLRSLVDKSDVLIENFAPGVMDKLGVGAAALRARNPRLIYAYGSGYGSFGPYRDFLAMDLTIQAIGGGMSVTGFPDGPPVKAGAAVSDFLGGTHLYGAVLTALFDREKTGEGCAIETSMFDMCYHPLASNLSMTHMKNALIPRTGNRHGGLSVVPYNVYQCRDGYVAIICVKDAHWRSLVETMGLPELGQDSAYSTNRARAQNIDEVDRIVGEWAIGLGKEEIFLISQEKRFPAAPVRDLKELSADPHLHERKSLQYFDHPVLGRIVLAASPIRIQDLEPMPFRRNPELGEHSAALLAEFLNLDDHAVAALRDSGVLGDVGLEPAQEK